MPTPSEEHAALLNAHSVRKITTQRLRILAEFEAELDQQWAAMAELPLRERLAGSAELFRLWRVWRSREDKRAAATLAGVFARAQATGWSLREMEPVAGIAFNAIGHFIGRYLPKRARPRP